MEVVKFIFIHKFIFLMGYIYSFLVNIYNKYKNTVAGLYYINNVLKENDTIELDNASGYKLTIDDNNNYEYLLYCMQKKEIILLVILVLILETEGAQNVWVTGLKELRCNFYPMYF